MRVEGNNPNNSNPEGVNNIPSNGQINTPAQLQVLTSAVTSLFDHISNGGNLLSPDNLNQILTSPSKIFTPEQMRILTPILESQFPAVNFSISARCFEGPHAGSQSLALSSVLNSLSSTLQKTHQLQYSTLKHTTRKGIMFNLNSTYSSKLSEYNAIISDKYTDKNTVTISTPAELNELSQALKALEAALPSKPTWDLWYTFSQHLKPINPIESQLMNAINITMENSMDAPDPSMTPVNILSLINFEPSSGVSSEQASNIFMFTGAFVDSLTTNFIQPHPDGDNKEYMDAIFSYQQNQYLDQLIDTLPK